MKLSEDEKKLIKKNRALKKSEEESVKTLLKEYPKTRRQGLLVGNSLVNFTGGSLKKLIKDKIAIQDHSVNSSESLKARIAELESIVYGGEEE